MHKPHPFSARVHAFATVTAFAVTVAVLVMPVSAAAWGREGHAVVALEAQALLAGTPTAAHVNELVGSDWSAAAEWLDCVKGPHACGRTPTPDMRAFTHRYPRHAHFHYTDIPIEEEAYDPASVGADRDDVVAVLSDAIRILEGHAPRDPGHDFDRRTALLIVFHLVGDIHQPLHVGALYVDGRGAAVDPHDRATAQADSTLGGNTLCVGDEPLHRLWDDEFVEAAAHGRDPTGLARELARAARGEAELWEESGDPALWPQRWASESLNVAYDALDPVVLGRHWGGERPSCRLQNDEPGPPWAWSVTLPSDYRAHASVVVRQQLLRAGTRLALVLETVLH